MTSILLERSRIVNPPRSPGEDNYHVLRLLSKSDLVPRRTWRILPHTAPSSVTGRDWDELQSAMRLFLDDDSIRCTFDVLVAILHLGEMELIAVSALAGNSDFQSAAALLKMDHTDLSTRLTTKTFTIGKETKKLDLPLVDVKHGIHALMTDLYAATVKVRARR